MTELIGCGNSVSRHHGVEKPSAKKFSYAGLFTCLATLVLAFIFKDYFMYVLSYLDDTANKNALEFHLILIVLFIGVSLPMLWGYTICILICAYVYSFLTGFCIVVFYSTIGMAVSFFVCRYVFYEYANERVRSVQYLRAICAIIESRDKGLYIVFLSRLMPIPFGLANTIFALTDIDFRKYILISIAGLVPTHLILCYIGSTLKSMSDVLENDSTARTASFVFVLQLILAVVVMYYLLHAAKLELDKHIGEKGPLPSPVGVGDSCSSLLSANGNESCKLLSGSSSSVIQMA